MQASTSPYPAQVVATFRTPDGDRNAPISGLQIVIGGAGLNIDLAEAIVRAQARSLYVIDQYGRATAVHAVDRNRDGRDDYITTHPDNSRTNNLLSLHIETRSLAAALAYLSAR